MSKKIKPYLMILPSISIVVLIFIVGLFFATIKSLGYFPEIGLDNYSLVYYKEIFTNKEFLSSFFFSLRIAFISSIVSVVFGLMLAIIYFHNKVKDKTTLLTIDFPIAMPHIIVGFFVVSLLSQTGIISRLLFALGLISDSSQFYMLVYDKGGIGIIIAYIIKGTPFILMLTLAVLKKINMKYIDIAMNLGANYKQALLHIIIPIITPTVLSGFVILFSYSFAAYELPTLLGPSIPKSLAELSVIHYYNIDFVGKIYASAVNIVITLLSLVFVFLYVKSTKFLSKVLGGYY